MEVKKYYDLTYAQRVMYYALRFSIKKNISLKDIRNEIKKLDINRYEEVLLCGEDKEVEV